MSPCKIEEYVGIAQKLKELLDLDKEPVAVKLFLSKEEAENTLSKHDGKARHCEMVFEASEGKSCYASLDEQLCRGGAAALGMCDFPEPVRTGEKYYALGRFASAGSAKHELDQVPKIDNIIDAVGYAPLKDAKFEADVIVMYLKPVQAMKLVQANGYVLGKRFNASFAGIQSLCADVVASPFINKEPNMSLGCSGSRKFTGFKPEEVVVGLTAENLGCILNSLESLSK